MNPLTRRMRPRKKWYHSLEDLNLPRCYAGPYTADDMQVIVALDEQEYRDAHDSVAQSTRVLEDYLIEHGQLPETTGLALYPLGRLSLEDVMEVALLHAQSLARELAQSILAQWDGDDAHLHNAFEFRYVLPHEIGTWNVTLFGRKPLGQVMTRPQGLLPDAALSEWLAQDPIRQEHFQKALSQADYLQADALRLSRILQVHQWTGPLPRIWRAFQAGAAVFGAMAPRFLLPWPTESLDSLLIHSWLELAVENANDLARAQAPQTQRLELFWEDDRKITLRYLRGRTYLQLVIPPGQTAIGTLSVGLRNDVSRPSPPDPFYPSWARSVATSLERRLQAIQQEMERV